MDILPQNLVLPNLILTDILRLREDLPSGISLEDASVLFVASDDQSILLTSDKVLRRYAKELRIEVHGLLWVMDRLVARGRILPSVAANRLERLCAMGTTRLPEKDCNQRIKKWRNS